jgi:hypothetical protein
MDGKENIGKIVTLVFKAIGLAMAVAVIVLSLLGATTVTTQVGLLGIGLFGLALASLQQGEPDEQVSKD